MVGTVKTATQLTTSADTIYADGRGNRAIITPDVRQFEEDKIASFLPVEVALTYAGTMTWAMDTNPLARVVMTGNPTITFSGGVNGGNYTLSVFQDSTGSRTPTISGATLKGTATWATAANDVNFISVYVSNGTRYYTVI
jgi:hypothetical protein